ncbi:hypothetical protein BURPS668_A2949 [Burkholderia pseudomallei 668]|nr:hypothetical protein BURPS668_A2949 [Burkholderia pseudomallei 668]
MNATEAALMASAILADTELLEQFGRDRRQSRRRRLRYAWHIRS